MYIRFINDDDTTGSCECANGVKFPGLNAYVAGLNGQNLPDGYSDCTNFGLPAGYWNSYESFTEYGDSNA